jgi:hypothetical protein
MISQFNKLKNKFQKGPQGGEMPGSGLLPSGGSGPAANPGGLVTPLTNISTFRHFLVIFPLIRLPSTDNNIQNAIKACRPETRGLMRNREQMQTVKETQNDGYCDVQGSSNDLERIGDLGEIKVYAAPGTSSHLNWIS